MPTIKTNKGNIKYSVEPLFVGRKQIDRAKAMDNLLIFDKIAKNISFKYLFAFGTILGAVRDKNFIEHDEDIDLMIHIDDENKLLDSLHPLIEQGFKVARYQEHKLMSIIRNNEYIDIYIFSPHSEYKHLLLCAGHPIKDSYYYKSISYPFRGHKFLIPEEYEEYLTLFYNDWKTPVKYTDYNIPFHKKILFYIKDWVKTYAPKVLVERIHLANETKTFQKYYNFGKSKGIL